MDIIRNQLKRVAGAGRSILGVLPLAISLGCADTPGGEIRRASASPPRGEGGSPVSLDSALTLFRRDLAPIDTLEHAERSMARLIEAFGRSVERSDTATIRRIVMSRREYAYLYYPTSPFTRPPSKQEPGLQWFLHLEHSQKGASRLLGEYGGRPLRILRNECRPPARVEGKNVLWDDCRQTLLLGRDTLITRLFGGVYERDGRFKIFSYSNDL